MGSLLRLRDRVSQFRMDFKGGKVGAAVTVAAGAQFQFWSQVV